MFFSNIFSILFHYYLQGIISEYPNGEQFLNQHGNIGLFADGFTSFERKYLKFLIIQMSGEIKDVQNIDMNKVRNSLIFITCTRHLPFYNANVLSIHHFQSL